MVPLLIRPLVFAPKDRIPHCFVGERLVGKGEREKRPACDTRPLAYVVAGLLFDPGSCGVLDGSIVAAVFTIVDEHWWHARVGADSPEKFQVQRYPSSGNRWSFRVILWQEQVEMKADAAAAVNSASKSLTHSCSLLSCQYNLFWLLDKKFAVRAGRSGQEQYDWMCE